MEEPKYSGKDLMLAVEQADWDKLLDIAMLNKSKKSNVSFKSVMSDLSDDDFKLLWSRLRQSVEERTKQLFLPPPVDKKLHQEVCLFLQATIDLGVVYFEHHHTNNSPTSAHLLSIVVHLNGTLLKLPTSLESLRNSIAGLCEKMFLSNEQLYQDQVCLNTLLYVLNRSLLPRAAKKEVKRVHALRSLLLRLLNHPQVLPLIKKAAQSPLYVAMPEGQKVIQDALTAHVDTVDEFHEIIKQRLAICNTSQAEGYGKIYYHSWLYAVKGKLSDLKSELEMTCIQNIMMLACEGRQKQMVANYRKVLQRFHSQKKEVYVSKMLYFLYQPILWRFIKNPDGVIRANASSLFLDVFPLEDPELRELCSDTELNDQVLIIKDLLLDDFPIVRAATAIGLCIAISVNWELFPGEMLKTYFKILVNDLSCDSSSSDVRLAVAKGLKVVLENPLSLETMEKILPKVQHLFHDVSEVVRIAFCQLLIRVKRISSIKYWRIVPLEHLLARLEDDAALSRPLVSLLHNSYFPPNEPPSVWLHRCVEMVKADREASKVFFRHVSAHIGLEATALFMKRVVECINFYVTSKVNSKSLFVLSSTPKTPKRREDYEKECAAKEEALGLHDPEVVSGLLDGVAILWLANITQLEKKENKQLLKMVVSKFTKCLGNLSLYYKDTPVWQSIYYLCSFMPSVPSLAPLCFMRLQALSPDAPEDEYLTLLECLCAQEGESFLRLTSEWVAEGLLRFPSTEEDTAVAEEKVVKTSAPKKRKRSKRKSARQEEEEEPEKKEEESMKAGEGHHRLAVRLLGATLDRRSCQKALLITKPKDLREVLHFMEDVKGKVELSLGKGVSEKDSEFLRGLFLLLLKIAVLLRGEDEHFSAIKYVEDVISWLQSKVLLPPTTRKSVAYTNTPSFQGMVRGMCEDLCSVLQDMTVLGFLNMKSLNFLKFAMTLLQSDEFGGGCMLLPVCHLMQRHVTFGAYASTQGDEGAAVLKIVPDCYAKIFQQIAREEFFESIPLANLKDCGSLLSASLQQLEAELQSAVTLSLLKALMRTPTTPQSRDEPQEEWDSLQEMTIAPSGAIMLSIVCTKPKLLVSFLQQLQRHVAKTEMDTQSYAACFAIVNTVREHKKCTKAVRRELVVLLESMDCELREPLKTLDTNVPPPAPLMDPPTLKGDPPLSFEEHCLNECRLLKERLTKKVNT